MGAFLLAGNNMQPITILYSLTAPDDDGICAAQQRVGAGVLSLNGVLVVGGIATLGTKVGYQIGIASSGNLSAVTFTVVGKDTEGRALTEAIAGPNNNTVETTAYFNKVTSVSVSATIGTNAIVGTVDEIATGMVPVNHYTKSTSVLVNISGTINYTVQSLLQNPYDTTLNDATHVWIDHTTLASKTTDAADSYISPIRAVRVKTNSFSSAPTIELSLVQARHP